MITNNAETENFIITSDFAGERLDKILKLQFPDFSRAYFQFLIEGGHVLANGKRVKKREKPPLGTEVEVTFQITPEMELTPEPIPLEILFEDDYLIAINKPAGMVVHPAPGHRDGTFVNALLHHCSELKGFSEDDLRPGIIHRLDKETTGVLLAAKSRSAHQKMVDCFKNREIEKKYLAITIGNPGNVTIDRPIGRHPVKRKEMCIRREGGKEALSIVETVQHGEKYALVSIDLKSGRTHQARVHLRSVGTPILGDPVYGVSAHNDRLRIHRQLLHAASLSFVHPFTKEPLFLTAPEPTDFAIFKKNLLD